MHIADAVGQSLREKQRIGLLGTRPTMEESFYRQRLQANWGLEVLLPAKSERQETHDIIFQELVCGLQGTARQRRWLAWCEQWCQRENLDALVMACTELNLLVKLFSQQIVILDSLDAHVQQVMEFFKGCAP